MSLIDICFPKFCLGCGRTGNYLCPNCDQQLKRVIKDGCFYCHKNSPHGLTHIICRKKNGIDGVMSFFYYDNLLKKIIKKIKYRLSYEVWSEIKHLVRIEDLEKLSFFAKTGRGYYLLPVPLSEAKLKIRGFNQAKLICQYFNKYLKLPIFDAMEKIKETASQAEIKDKKQRSLNQKGAFDITEKKEVMNNNFIIIDDVVTTGATVREICRLLKRYGAKKVYVLTLAKGS